MSNTRARVFVGLGRNLQRPAQQLRKALTELDQLPQTRLVGHSMLYGSKPLGPTDQPDYVNAVAQLQTGLDPHALLDELQRVEQRHGRERAARWGPRTLDLDILLFGTDVIESARLRVPHPQLHRRAFVLAPLHELAPDLELPGLGPLRDVVAAVDDSSVWPLQDPLDS